MKDESKNLSAEQSLALITGMIRQAQGNISYNTRYILLWGWCIAIAHFSMYGLIKFTDYRYPYFVWLITIPATIITIIMAVKESHEKVTYSHLDQITMWVWISLFFIIGPVIGFAYKIHFQINPLILLFTAFPTFITGIILRFKPLVFGGISFWIIALLCFVVDKQTQPLLGGIAVILGYLIPGYMLKNSKA